MRSLSEQRAAMPAFGEKSDEVVIRTVGFDIWPDFQPKLPTEMQVDFWSREEVYPQERSPLQATDFRSCRGIGFIAHVGGDAFHIIPQQCPIGEINPDAANVLGTVWRGQIDR